MKAYPISCRRSGCPTSSVEDSRRASIIEEFADRRDPGAKAEQLSGLTERELEVLIEVARGRSNDEMAATLTISPLTAKTHVSRILSKLSARDRAQLVAIAYETGLVVPGAD